MNANIGNNKDFWAGAMLIAIGVAAAWIARDYPFGSTFRMGAGYFPSVLGGVLGGFSRPDASGRDLDADVLQVVVGVAEDQELVVTDDVAQHFAGVDLVRQVLDDVPGPDLLDRIVLPRPRLRQVGDDHAREGDQVDVDVAVQERVAAAEVELHPWFSSWRPTPS